MAKFGRVINKLLKNEGVRFGKNGKPIKGKTGYGNHPRDKGKETNYGITIAVARRNGYRGPMRDIPFAEVLRIYKLRYWDKLRCSDIPDQTIANEMFDGAANCGPRTMGRFLQRALNLFNKEEVKYADLVVDGKVGKKTIRTLKRALSMAWWVRIATFRAINALRRRRYIRLAEEQKRYETFIGGWLMRD